MRYFFEERLHCLFIAVVIGGVKSLTFGHKNIRKIFGKTEIGLKDKLMGIEKGRYKRPFKM